MAGATKKAIDGSRKDESLRRRQILVIGMSQAIVLEANTLEIGHK